MIFSWEYKDINYEKASQLSKETGLPLVVVIILMNRNFDTPDRIQSFFDTDLSDLYDPFLMKDMEKAVERTTQALFNRERVTIFGDYDVDGTTSTALLTLFLTEIGLDVNYYIPDREREGYGLSKEGIDFACTTDSSLIISCDCGINAFDEINYANAKGLDVIVTDHHEPAEFLPEAVAIIDPKRNDDSYPFKELCGAGVAYKFLQGLCQKNDLSTEKLNRHLDLVAIGTAADIVPILDENRILVAHGLKQVQNSSKKGIHSLLSIAGFKNRPINVVNIVFGLAPRINAAGRLGEAARAVRLLMATDRHETDDLAKHLDRLNRSRQQIERGTINEAIMQYNRDVIDDGEKIIVLSGESWHQGVIGIVASKLKEQYNKPVILISVQDGIGKGSARSIPNFDLYQALSQCSDLLESYGGHKMAAGLTIKEENIKEFIQRIKTNADHAITDDMLSPSLSVECEISFQDINQNLLSYLNKMAPFGPGNMRPVFTAKNLIISGLPRIVGENHLKFKACQNKIVISAIGWNLGNYYNMLISNRALNMAFVIEENRWNNIREIQLNIKDIHYADASEE